MPRAADRVMAQMLCLGMEGGGLARGCDSGVLSASELSVLVVLVLESPSLGVQEKRLIIRVWYLILCLFVNWVYTS